MIYQGKARHPVRGAVLHCAAIKTNQFKDWSAFHVMREINRWHVERGFRLIGYHALIMPSGEVLACRPATEVGAHVLDHNQGTLGVLLIESKEIKAHVMLPERPQEWRSAVFSDWFTDAQRIACQRYLGSIHGLEWVKGHNDFAPKLCPGFRVQSDDWLNGVRPLS
jgi:N-acetylmuramoyl-L-alanine amidase